MKHNKPVKFDEAVENCKPYKMVMPNSKEYVQALLNWDEIKFEWLVLEVLALIYLFFIKIYSFDKYLNSYLIVTVHAV